MVLEVVLGQASRGVFTLVDDKWRPSSRVQSGPNTPNVIRDERSEREVRLLSSAVASPERCLISILSCRSVGTEECG